MIEPKIEGRDITQCGVVDLTLVVHSGLECRYNDVIDAPFTASHCFGIVQSIAKHLLIEKHQ